MTKSVNQIATTFKQKTHKPIFRLLVAEDNDDLRQILSDFVHLIGVQGKFAVNGQEAFEMLAAESPDHFDAILSDISMPIMDGFDLLIKMRENSFSHPFIFMTAAATEENVNRAALLGITEVLAKPFNIEELRQCLNRILQISLPEN